MRDSFEFKTVKNITEMWIENESSPFDDLKVALIKKSHHDGYYRFYPLEDVSLNCKHLRNAAIKLSELNGQRMET